MPKKFLVNLIAIFLFNKEKRQRFRKRFLRNGKIISRGENEILAHRDWNGQIKIFGSQNQIILKSGNTEFSFEISIWGNNNRILIEEDVFLLKTNIFIGESDCPCNNSKISIGAGTSIDGGSVIRVMDSGSKICVGKDVMCSRNVHIWASDTHAILDSDGQLKNRGHEVVIGDHVWLGLESKIGKNTEIGAGSIVGWGSVVPRGDYPEKSLIVGNPACVKKTGVLWSRKRPNLFIDPLK